MNIRSYVPNIHGIILILSRFNLLKKLKLHLKESPVAILLGARQVGKTTLAKLLATEFKTVHHFDLEKEKSKAALAVTPELVLESLKGLVLIDEIQRMPALFSILRPLADRKPIRARFLLLGSASPEIVAHTSETLAGRIRYLDIPGLSLEEVGKSLLQRLWMRGGFPRSFLATSEGESWRWRESFVRTFLERDLPGLGISVPFETMRRFWTMLCHYHGQKWNSCEIAASLGFSDKTVHHYLDILAGTYMVRILPPWFENVGKRLVKSPKIYIADSGLFHFLLGIDGIGSLRMHPKYGASWEGFALTEVLKRFPEGRAYHYSTHQGAELDLLLEKNGQKIGFEFKCVDAPVMTKSLHNVLHDLKLKKIFVVYPGTSAYPLHEKVSTLPMADLWTTAI